MSNLDGFFFAALPYISLVLFFGATVYRYRMQAFTYSSLSSQFLENRHHFWALVPFHYGIMAVLFGHIVAFLIPRQVLLWNSVPLRLWILEITTLVFAILSLVGLLAIVLRRRSSKRVRIVTSKADWVLYLMLLIQIATGIWVALAYPWGSSWFATSMAPYLWSLLKLSPATEYIVGMPLLVKIHVINAFFVDRVLSIHPPGPRSGHTEPLSVAQKTGGALGTHSDESTHPLVCSWRWVWIYALFLLVPRLDSLRLPDNHKDFQPTQPIAYSHRLHAGELGIDCQYCHTGARRSRHAGIPPASLCMNCHRYITATRAQVRQAESEAEGPR